MIGKATTDHVGAGNIWEQRLFEGSHDFDEDHWALFHLPEDFAETNDVSADHPDVVRRLIDEWFQEAQRNNVLPITDAMHGRAPDQIIPPLYPPRARSVFLPGGSPVFDKWVPSFMGGARIIADVEAGGPAAEGILCALGDRTSGFALYVKDGNLVFAMSSMGSDAKVAAALPELSGRHQLVCALMPDGDHIEFGLEADGRRLGGGRGLISVPFLWQFGGSGLCLGYDRPLAVTDDYSPPFRWPGTVHSITVEVPSGGERDIEAEIRATLSSE